MHAPCFLSVPGTTGRDWVPLQKPVPAQSKNIKHFHNTVSLRGTVCNQQLLLLALTTYTMSMKSNGSRSKSRVHSLGCGCDLWYTKSYNVNALIHCSLRWGKNMKKSHETITTSLPIIPSERGGGSLKGSQIYLPLNTFSPIFHLRVGDIQKCRGQSSSQWSRQQPFHFIGLVLLSSSIYKGTCFIFAFRTILPPSSSLPISFY